MKTHKHTLSHYRLMTFDLGQLVPVGLTEVLPGDTFDHSTSALIRLSPLAAPVMHPMWVRLHHFFVPHRIIWEEAGGTGSFEDFITSGSDGNDAQTVPTVVTDGTSGDLMDYYGVPPIAGVAVSALPTVGFNRIFNYFYRDQDLTPERTLLSDWSIPHVAWEKDYLSSSRPWPQKGADITLPIAGAAPIKTDATAVGGGKLGIEYSDQLGDMDASQATLRASSGTAEGGYLYADLTAAEAVKVNEFRKAFALQRYAEARARYGSRYVEYLKYLGINPSFARVQEPEYLGGGRQRVSTSEILQTAPEGSTPVRDFGVGDLYGHGVAAMRTNRYRRFFEEHGYVHTLMSVRPKAMYLQSINRTWLRKTREDFWQRELEHIGQQPVLKNEAYADPVDGSDTWGYQDRYRDYREVPSGVAGEFRDVLNYWHLGRDFGVTDPVLNTSFVECKPSKRIFNEQTQHSLWVMAQHSLVARRKLSRNAGGHIF